MRHPDELETEEPDAQWFLRAGMLEEWADETARKGDYRGWYDPDRLPEMRTALAAHGLELVAEHEFPGSFFALTPAELEAA